jgi:hypothetical protein
MATAPTTTPAPAPSAPGPATPDDEKAAAVSATLLGFLLGGPVGGIVMALAIGIEQAFGKSGWDQPGWLGGDKAPSMSPEEIKQRHDDAVRRALEWVAEARRQAKARRWEWADHRRRMREYTEGGSEGPRPERPERRGPGEFLGDLYGASKSWYTLFDDKMAKGNEKITGTYPAIAEFFRSLWNFVTGFAEGVKRGWEQHQEQKNGQPDPTGSGPDGDADGPDPGPESLPPLDERPELDPATENPDPTAQPGPEPDAEQPGGSPQPPPDDDREPFWAGPASTPGPGELNPGPDGPGEGTVEGEPMSTDGAAALPAGAAVPHMGPQGETNLDLLYQAFHPAPPVLTRIALQVDELQAQALAVNARVARIAALCAVHGAPVVVYHMMNEARTLVGALNNGLGDIDVNTEVARELTDEALIGLLPAADDLQTVRGEQASGDALNRAGH